MLSQERRRQRSFPGRVESTNARQAGQPPTRRSQTPSPDMFQTDGGPTLPSLLARATEKPAQIDLTDLFHDSLQILAYLHLPLNFLGHLGRDVVSLCSAS
jgi:hypothetical protein